MLTQDSHMMQYVVDISELVGAAAAAVLTTFSHLVHPLPHLLNLWIKKQKNHHQHPNLLVPLDHQVILHPFILTYVKGR